MSVCVCGHEASRHDDEPDGCWDCDCEAWTLAGTETPCERCGGSGACSSEFIVADCPDCGGEGRFSGRHPDTRGGGGLMGERLEVGQRRRWKGLPVLFGQAPPAEGLVFVVENIDNPRRCKGRYVEDRVADFTVATRDFMESYSTVERAQEPRQ